jgi:choline kinase
MQIRTVYSGFKNDQVRTALLLAAGTGSRLAPLTDMQPKCLVSVNKISILERLIHSLKIHKFKRLVVVIGHQGDCIRNFLGTRAGGMEISYINSPLYKTTNNIYSLWLARKAIDEPFLLLESDLVFDSEMLKNMLQPDRIAVAKLRPWMDGTTVTINSNLEIASFHCGAHKHDDNQYKTVNIYSLSTMTWQLLRERLDLHISNNMVNGYYETVFADMVSEGCVSFKPVFFDPRRWYEIDTIADLRAAERVCSIQHHQPVIVTNHNRISDHNGASHLPSYERFDAIARIKRGPSRHPVNTVSSSMMPTSTLPQ